MKIKAFLSDQTYVILPTKKAPKVFLPVADFKTVTHAFELYNPFSRKAKILKGVARFLCQHMKPIARVLFPTVRGKKSDLNVFLEKKLSKSITSSVYLATANDKVVLQLQDTIGVFGYLKFPISELGKERLLNEQKAIELLSEKRIIPPLLMKGEFNDTPFILLKPIKGEIGSVTKKGYATVLNSFKKEEVHLLSSHPRVLSLVRQLAEVKLTDLSMLLNQTIRVSKKKYAVVYEHGDFAPWNLVATTKGIIPFDFEYFEENGLEHLDELKFHFQEQHLLHHKEGKNLISAIASKVAIDEFDCIFNLFLLKEIANKTNSEESVEFERSLLNQFIGV